MPGAVAGGQSSLRDCTDCGFSALSRAWRGPYSRTRRTNETRAQSSRRARRSDQSASAHHRIMAGTRKSYVLQFPLSQPQVLTLPSRTTHSMPLMIARAPSDAPTLAATVDCIRGSATAPVTNSDVAAHPSNRSAIPTELSAINQIAKPCVLRIVHDPAIQPVCLMDRVRVRQSKFGAYQIGCVAATTLP